MKRVAILGAGGHARVVRDVLGALADAGHDVHFAGFIDPGLPKGGAVLGGDDALPELVAQARVTHYVLGIGSVKGGADLRRSLVAMAETAGARPVALVHPSAVVSPSAEMEPGAVIMALVCVNAGAQIGAHAVVNTRSSVDHDGRIGAFAHIAPGAVLSGEVRIGDNALIGVGAAISNGICVGADATVAAGAAVVADIPAAETWGGVPARKL